MKKGILFDLDGTLWDSSEQVVISWNEVLRKYDLPEITTEDMKRYMGKTMEAIAMMMLPQLDDEKRSIVFGECCDYEVAYLQEHGGVLFEGLEETLKQLSQDYELFIVSNCQVGYIESFLEYHHLGQYFTEIESYGNTGMGKGPNIRLVVERNHLEQCFYVGDIQGDLNAADEAGIPFVHAAYGFGTVNREVEKIDAITQLPACAKRMFEGGLSEK